MTTLLDVREYIEEIFLPKDEPTITHLFVHPDVWEKLGRPDKIEVRAGAAVLVGTDPDLPFRTARAGFVPESLAN